MSKKRDDSELSFKIGRPYFLIGFPDRQLQIPDIDTYVYVGREIDVFGETAQKGRNWYCFKDTDSVNRFGKSARDQSENEEAIVLCFDQNDAGQFQDLSALIEELSSIKAPNK